MQQFKCHDGFMRREIAVGVTLGNESAAYREVVVGVTLDNGSASYDTIFHFSLVDVHSDISPK